MNYNSAFRPSNENDDPIPYRSTSSDAAGRFAIVLPREALDRPQILAFASLEGFATKPLKLTAAPHQKSLEVKLELAESKTVQLQLVDSAGNPAAGVEPEVWFLDRAKTAFMYLGDRRAARLLKSWPKCSRTDEDGFTRVVIPAPVEDVVLLVESERFGSQTLPFKPSSDLITLALKPGRHLSGRIIAADTSASIAGADVLIQENPRKVTRTDENGRFRVAAGDTASQPSLGETYIKVFPPASSPYLFHWHEWKWPDDVVTDAELTIRMARGIMVEGDIVEKGAGKSVAGASIYYAPQEYDNEFFRPSENSGYQWPFESIYKTDEKGQFRIPVSPGPGYLMVKVPTRDYVRVMVSGGERYYGKVGLDREYYDGARHINLKPGESPKPLRIELQRGITLRRRVVRPDGRPAMGQAYNRSDEIDRLLNGGAGVASVADGILELPGFEPEHSNPLFIVDLEHHCGATVSPAASEVDLASPPIRLQPTGSASFRFIDDKGKPLANYGPTLLLIVTPGAPATRVYEAGQPLWADSAYWRSIANLSLDEWPKTDAEGRVTIHDLIPGATYRVSSQDKHGRSAEINEFTVRPGETMNVGDVTIPLQD